MRRPETKEERRLREQREAKDREQAELRHEKAVIDAKIVDEIRRQTARRERQVGKLLSAASILWYDDAELEKGFAAIADAHQVRPMKEGACEVE
jgi:hypothetical protein